jgi:hypothetical protein
MLSHEWRELEVLCGRISDLRHRYAAALKTNNAGLVEGLKADLAQARRLRGQVVQHISARLGWAAANEAHSQPAPDPAPDAEQQQGHSKAIRSGATSAGGPP